MTTVRWRRATVGDIGTVILCPMVRLPPPLRAGDRVEAGGVFKTRDHGTFLLPAHTGTITHITSSGTFAQNDFGNDIHQYHAVKALRRV